MSKIDEATSGIESSLDKLDAKAARLETTVFVLYVLMVIVYAGIAVSTFI